MPVPAWAEVVPTREATTPVPVTFQYYRQAAGAEVAVVDREDMVVEAGAAAPAQIVIRAGMELMECKVERVATVAQEAQAAAQ